VIARLAERALWLDLRCLQPVDEAAFVQQLGGLQLGGLQLGGSPR
jgi:hypothetical protein